MSFVCRGYGRVSTDKQAASIEVQEANVLDQFKLNVRTIPDWADAKWGGFFADQAISRDSYFRERPQGSLIIGSSRPGDYIMAMNYDRVFARFLDACETLEIIEQFQIRLKFLDFPIDLGCDLGKAFFQIMAIFKNMELKAIRERTKAALQHRKVTGRPHTQAPHGWKCQKFLLYNKVVSYYVKDEFQRKVGAQLLEMNHGRPWSVYKFYDWVVKQGWMNHEGKPWVRSTFYQFLKAAKAGFPLHNGSLEAFPVPKDAIPLNPDNKIDTK